MANVSVSNITLSAIVSVTVSIVNYSASASYTDVIYSTDGASVSYNYELIETRPLSSVSVSVSESLALTFIFLTSVSVTVTSLLGLLFACLEADSVIDTDTDGNACVSISS